MRRANLLASLIFTAFGLFLIRESRGYSYYLDIGPGPGFFPFWLGLIIALLSLIWLLQDVRQSAEATPGNFVPSRAGSLRIGAIVLAGVLFTWLVNILGFQLTMLAFLLFLLYSLGRQKVVVTMAVAIVGSFGLFIVFNNFLDVHLPLSSIEFLANLGL